jgi:hypothetical protein
MRSITNEDEFQEIIATGTCLLYLIQQFYASDFTLPSCATPASAGGGTNLVSYGTPVSIARLISS